MFSYQYQIQDSEQNTAVVKLVRDHETNKVTVWRNLTPGAFAPGVALNDDQEAHRVASGVHGQMLACDTTYENGEAVGCFTMYNYFIGATEHAFVGQGEGMLFERGVHGGKLLPGPMTWTQIRPD